MISGEARNVIIKQTSWNHKKDDGIKKCVGLVFVVLYLLIVIAMIFRYLVVLYKNRNK